MNAAGREHGDSTFRAKHCQSRGVRRAGFGLGLRQRGRAERGCAALRHARGRLELPKKNLVAALPSVLVHFYFVLGIRAPCAA